MDPRRPPRTVIDPKIRHVGFAPQQDPLCDTNRTTSVTSSPPVTYLYPVMIPPPPHDATATTTTSLPRPVPVPRRPAATAVDSVPVGSYDPSESLLATSPVSSSQNGDREFSDDSHVWFRSDSEKFSAVPSVPGIGFNMFRVNSAEESLPVASEVNEGLLKKLPTDNRAVADVSNKSYHAEKSGAQPVDRQVDMVSNLNPVKGKPTKAERRALQEAQRAAKARKYVGGGTAPEDSKADKVVKQPPRKNASLTVASSTFISEKKSSERLLDKDKKKDVPAPRMQYDDKSRVERAKKRSIVPQTEARNRVELFRHLPQYEHGDRLPDLESKIFLLDGMHPAIYKVGVQYLTGDISGGNARCIAMLNAFKEAIKNYSTPPEKVLFRDLAARIGSFVSFLIECRPLSISMGNAIRYLKGRIAKLPLGLSESEVKASLCADLDCFIHEKIVIADKVIVGHASTKVRDGDVLLTFGCSSVVEMILLYAHEQGKRFRVIIVDSRPKLEGQALLRRLVAKGISCTYTHINAVSYVMREVTRVFLGAASVLSNGTVYSRVGTACVAMVAHAFQVPVLICCEAYKFHERVLLDSICSNELGDPDAISKVSGRGDLNYLDKWITVENLQLLNLLYDATPSDYVSLIVTDYGMVPPTSVPVIVREYRKEHLLV